jgi:hypothetical protein
MMYIYRWFTHEESPMQCSQCGKPAETEDFADVPFCYDCYDRAMHDREPYEIETEVCKECGAFLDDNDPAPDGLCAACVVAAKPTAPNAANADVEIDGVVHDIPREHMPPAFDWYAWPGGYPLAYYPLSDRGDLDGSVLCPGCAKTEYDAWEPDEWNPAPPTFHAEIEEEVHDNIWCDGCRTVFIYQTWCDFCQESVDCDEAHPTHTCKPLKWSLETAYTGYVTEHTRRYATREAARSMARYYRNRGYHLVRVTPIVPPIMPEN